MTPEKEQKNTYEPSAADWKEYARYLENYPETDEELNRRLNAAFADKKGMIEELHLTYPWFLGRHTHHTTLHNPLTRSQEIAIQAERDAEPPEPNHENTPER